jgi:uncharacterized protein
MTGQKRIWIDLDNSPHVPFFAPIIKDLERRGYSVILTARDAYQVWDLADFFQLSYHRVGHHYGKNKVLKVFGTCTRALQLIAIMARSKPALAVAHTSRSQTLACLLLRIPSIAMCDYEFSDTSVHSRATWVMVPEVVACADTAFKAENLLTYPGIKEDVYAPSFKPDPSISRELGLDEGANVVITVRPPAVEAHYHNPESDKLFDAVMELIGETDHVKAVLLPRNGRQAASLRKAWPALLASGKVIIPERALDGLNLIWHSDLVISGGGTMNREAAALGVPVYSIFRGKIGAVDRYLAETGRMVLTESVADVRTKIKIEKRPRTSRVGRNEHPTLTSVVDQIASIAESGSPASDQSGLAATIGKQRSPGQVV